MPEPSVLEIILIGHFDYAVEPSLHVAFSHLVPVGHT